MKVVFRPEARRDVLLQVGYYLDEMAFDAAERFPEAIAQAIEHIQQHPESGSLKHFEKSELTGLRAWPVPGFENIQVYYTRPQRQLIRIIRILHGKRDLGSVFGVL